MAAVWRDSFGEMKPEHVEFAGIALLAVCACGCDKDPPGGEKPLASSTPSATPAPPPPPKPTGPTRPIVSVDDTAVTVNGSRVEFAAPDTRTRVNLAFAGKPLIEGETVDFDVSRETKTPKVGMVVAALKAAKAKGVVVHTPRRDKVMGLLPLAFPAARPAECSAVGMVSKDGSIAAWSLGGGNGARFSRGFAGPDLTLGSEGVRKVAGGCDSSVWFIAADDTITWGLAFDLAMAARGGEEGGTIRATQTAMVVEAPVPGRKVTLD